MMGAGPDMPGLASQVCLPDTGTKRKRRSGPVNEAEVKVLGWNFPYSLFSFLGSGLALVWGADRAYGSGPSCREEVDPPPDLEVLRAGRDPASGVSRHLDREPPLIFVWAGDRVVLIASFKIFLLHFPLFDGKS